MYGIKCTNTHYILKSKTQSQWPVSHDPRFRPHKICNSDFRLHQQQKTCGGNQCPNSKPSAQTVCSLILFVRATPGLGCWRIYTLKAIIAVFTYYNVFCLFCKVWKQPMHVCLLMPCGHLLGKGWPLALVCDALLWRCHVPVGIQGQVWCLIVSIPDLSPLSYFF